MNGKAGKKNPTLQQSHANDMPSYSLSESVTRQKPNYMQSYLSGKKKKKKKGKEVNHEHWDHLHFS
jgi:hypothetical protein